tara:strand:+ start:1024 stop:1239 length:216 start_codon:yes stop_codon:yes gene_type:complete
MKIKAEFKIRNNASRRANAKHVRFPMKADGGEVVLRERRVNPDRRHPGLETQELKVSPEEFEQLFQTYSKH